MPLFGSNDNTNSKKNMAEIKGLENSRAIKMIDIETKEVTIFRSIAYAVRNTGCTEYGIRQGLNPIQKKRFEVNGRIVCFRVHNT